MSRYDSVRAAPVSAGHAVPEGDLGGQGLADRHDRKRGGAGTPGDVCEGYLLSSVEYKTGPREPG